MNNKSKRGILYALIVVIIFGCIFFFLGKVTAEKEVRDEIDVSDEEYQQRINNELEMLIHDLELDLKKIKDDEIKKENKEKLEKLIEIIGSKNINNPNEVEKIIEQIKIIKEEWIGYHGKKIFDYYLYEIGFANEIWRREEDFTNNRDNPKKQKEIYDEIINNFSNSNQVPIIAFANKEKETDKKYKDIIKSELEMLVKGLSVNVREKRGYFSNNLEQLENLMKIINDNEINNRKNTTEILKKIQKCKENWKGDVGTKIFEEHMREVDVWQELWQEEKEGNKKRVNKIINSLTATSISISSMIGVLTKLKYGLMF